MTEPIIETHPCKSCGRPIDARYTFRVCVRCSLDALQQGLERDGYFARLQARREREAEEQDAARMRAKGLIAD